MNITEASNVSKHTKQEKAKEVINRPTRFRICLNLLETPKASSLANYANILNIGQQTKKKRIANTANRHYLPALAYLLPTIRRPQSPQPSKPAESFSPTKYIFSDKKQFYSIPRNLHFGHRCFTFFPPLTTLPQTHLRRICSVSSSNKGTQKRRKNEEGTKEIRSKWVCRGGKRREKDRKSPPMTGGRKGGGKTGLIIVRNLHNR